MNTSDFHYQSTKQMYTKRVVFINQWIDAGSQEPKMDK